MAKRPSLKKQVCDALYAQARFGQSKHEAKQEERARCERAGIPWNPARVPGIFSIGTMKNYREESIRFTEWVKAEHGCRWLAEAKEHVAEYLQNGIDRELSAWTLHKQAAALRKLYEDPDLAREVELPPRQLDSIKRSRNVVEMDKEIDLGKYRDMVDFCRATGLRRHELKAMKVGQVDLEAGMLRDVIGKGGRIRDVTIREELIENVRDCVINKEASDRIFDRVPVRMDVHSYRREYAQGRYEGVAGRPYEKGNANREALLEVSQDLGHGRINVVVDHYVR